MSDANSGTAVLVKNHTEAPQGVYEFGAASGEVATYIRPGQMKRVILDETTIKHLKANPKEFGVFPADAADLPDDSAGQPANGSEAAPADAFDAMSDDELRAFLTDRNQKPHNFAGRPKLLQMARAPAGAGDADETV